MIKLKKISLPAPKTEPKDAAETRAKIRRATSLIAYLIGCKREYVLPDLDRTELTLILEALEKYRRTLQEQLEGLDEKAV